MAHFKLYDTWRYKLKIVDLLISVLLLSIMSSATVSAMEAEFVITQQDENEIIKLTEEFNKCVRFIYKPWSSHIPFDEFQKCDVYKELIQYDWKLIPYLIRQIQIENESRVIVGSALAKRHIESLEDLYNYRAERSAKLRKGINPWLEFPEMLLAQTTVGKRVYQKLGKRPELTGFSWIEWWEKNKGRFEFKTEKPVRINAENKYFNYPHISTEQHDGLLDIEAVHATYRQIIERAAAELGVDVFIGAQVYIDIIATVRMKSMTFEEFAYLVGRTVFVRGFKYYKVGQKYHFGGKAEAKPRAIIKGWGIMMNKTVFYEGDVIPVTIITRDTGDLVSPLDPVFFEYGSFKITTNDGIIIKDYNIQKKSRPTIKLLKREKDSTKIQLDLSEYYQLPLGEYSVRFKYLSNETPSIAIEIYKERQED